MSEAIAFLCPGQGAVDRSALAAIRAARRFEGWRAALAAACGDDVIAVAEARGDDFIRRNRPSALLSMLASLAAHERLRDAGVRATAFAGYSVGQWTAMHLAGMLGFEDLVRVIVHRCKLMDETPATSGGMLAVIGLPAETVEQACGEVGDAWIANFNAPGQMTVSGTRAALASLKPKLAAANPIKLADVPVSGAWHSPLLKPAVEPFRAFLGGVALAAATQPVVSNVTGDWLPGPSDECRDQLAAHLCEPVRWDACVRMLRRHGIAHFIEVGHGNTLTKFGFFIDRAARHSTSQIAPAKAG